MSVLLFGWVAAHRRASGLGFSLAGRESLLPLVDEVRAHGPHCALLVVAGVGMGGHTRRCDGLPVREYGSVSDRTLRDLMCAADYVVENERRLTSGMLRTAMSYSTPVVAHKYGSAPDMCAGAAVFVEDAGSPESAIEQALGLEESEYEGMVAQANARNRGRSWKTAETRIASLFADLLK